jgi:hypothetical protein
MLLAGGFGMSVDPRVYVRSASSNHHSLLLRFLLAAAALAAPANPAA